MASSSAASSKSPPRLFSHNCAIPAGDLETLLQGSKLEPSPAQPLKEGSISDSAAVALVSGVDWQDDCTSPTEAQSSARALVVYINSRNSLPPATSDTADEQDSETVLASRYLDTIRTVCNGRCLFTTSSSSTGPGPVGTKVQNSVAILFGCPWPVILRAGAREGEHSFVGCCFVDGAMDGEATGTHQAAKRSTSYTAYSELMRIQNCIFIPQQLLL